MAQLALICQGPPHRHAPLGMIDRIGGNVIAQFDMSPDSIALFMAFSGQVLDTRAVTLHCNRSVTRGMQRPKEKMSAHTSRAAMEEKLFISKSLK